MLHMKGKCPTQPQGAIILVNVVMTILVAICASFQLCSLSHLCFHHSGHPPAHSGGSQGVPGLDGIYGLSSEVFPGSLPSGTCLEYLQREAPSGHSGQMHGHFS
ncbi:hypothetical protein ILYODFUR_013824 [Ilyodon furcidens]|uniref:Uncharacterized protein n=1 Tax=Ilyodon furcidens TaxID=33524 RepID=A0ABV0SX27_9TELE